jgi:hypothetical protein
MGDKSRSCLISSRSVDQPASPIESWMGSLANILWLLATAVLPLRDGGAEQCSRDGANCGRASGQTGRDDGATRARASRQGEEERRFGKMALL